MIIPPYFAFPPITPLKFFPLLSFFFVKSLRGNGQGLGPNNYY